MPMPMQKWERAILRKEALRSVDPRLLRELRRLQRPWLESLRDVLEVHVGCVMDADPVWIGFYVGRLAAEKRMHVEECWTRLVEATMNLEAELSRMEVRGL